MAPRRSTTSAKQRASATTFLLLLLLVFVAGAAVISEEENGAAATTSLRSHLLQRLSGRKKVTVKKAEDYMKALRSVAEGMHCGTKYTFDPSLYGTLTETDSDYMDGRGINFEKGGIYMAWLTDAPTLASFLNSAKNGCCGSSVRTLAQCYCQIAFRVGLRSKVPGKYDELDYLDYSVPYSYITLPVAKTTNATNPPGQVTVTIPTWENLIGQITPSFPTIFSQQPHVPSCEVDVAAIVSEMKAAKGDGHDSWINLFNDDPEMAKMLGATSAGVDEVTTAAFAALPDNRLCSNPLALRAFMWKYFDCNNLFQGTGYTLDGAPEVITMPNPKIPDFAAKKSTWLSSIPGKPQNKFCSSDAARAGRR